MKLFDGQEFIPLTFPLIFNNMKRLPTSVQARGSVVERFLDAEEAVGSIPSAPTRI